jgi:hypothetical protein
MSAGAVLQVAGRPSARGLFMNLGLNRVAARSIVIWVTAGFLVLLLFMGKLPAPSGLNELVISVGM